MSWAAICKAGLCKTARRSHIAVSRPISAPPAIHATHRGDGDLSLLQNRTFHGLCLVNDQGIHLSVLTSPDRDSTLRPALVAGLPD